jgi:glycosyltransferase involved in cell wall biosynthesis
VSVFESNEPAASRAAWRDNILARTTLVIPAYNEEAAIARVLDEVPRQIGQILVVDGVSTDETRAVAQNVDPHRIDVVRRTRRGKGNALACGIGMASGEFIVLMDGDGSASAADIAPMVTKLVDLGADFVKGYRESDGRADLKTRVRRLGTSALTRYFNHQFNREYLDVCCGFVALRQHSIDAFGLEWTEKDDRVRWHDGFEIDALLLGRAITSGLRIAEHPVAQLPRVGGETKTRALQDTQRIARVIAEAST